MYLLGTTGWARGLVVRIGKWSFATVFCILVATLGLEFDQRGIAIFVDTLDEFWGDWRIALGSPRAPDQRSDITIVLINEETLLDYESRSPVDRRLLTDIVQAIDKAQPRAIALDFIFDRFTSSDGRLIAAIKAARQPVILGAIDVRAIGAGPDAAGRESLERQKALLAAMGRPYGHLMLERRRGFLADNDSTVRYIAPALDYGNRVEKEPPGFTTINGHQSKQGIPPFVEVIAQQSGVIHIPANNVIAWLRSPSNYTLFSTITIPRHMPSEAKTAIAEIPGFDELIKGRIVFVGASMVDRDQHKTPLSVIESEKIPGVIIHAQALTQRIDGNRDIIVWPWWALLTLISMIAMICFRVAQTKRIAPHGISYGIAGLLLIGGVSFASFSVFHLEIPSIALAVAWALGGGGGLITGETYRRLGWDS